jgi:naphtho-gamma-pyrone polyketide synthase
MMGHSSQVLLFGDQTNAFESGLRALLLRKENVILNSFFERTHFALRLEIGKLGASERHLFPRFTSVSDLLVQYCKLGNSPALESALTVLYQLASFIS